MKNGTNTMAIVGAGVAGLTAAFKLQQRGIACTVYEASERCGGAIKTVRENGFLVECGPNTVLDTSPRLTELIADLGLAENRLNANSSSKNRYIVRDQKPVALPENPVSFFTSPAFSAPAKIRLCMEPLIRSKSHEAESLADFVRRRLGREFLDYAISPFVGGVYAGDPETLSVAYAFPKLYALEQEYRSLIVGAILGARKRKKRNEVSKKDARMFTFDRGIEVLTQRLQEKLGSSIRLNTPVESVDRTGESWLVNGNLHSGVVMAIPAHQLPLVGLPVDLSSFSEIYYPAVTSVSFGFNADQIGHSIEGFGMLIPRVEHFYSLGTLFTSSIFSGRAPDGQVMLTTFVGGSLGSEKALQSEGDIRAGVLGDLTTLLGIKGDPVYQKMSTYSQAIPQYTVGYERFLETMQSAEETHPGLYFAGSCRDGISVADSILSGLSVGERICS